MSLNTVQLRNNNCLTVYYRGNHTWVGVRMRSVVIISILSTQILIVLRYETGTVYFLCIGYPAVTKTSRFFYRPVYLLNISLQGKMIK